MSKTCSYCGTSWKEFTLLGKFGCQYCPEFFSKHEPTLLGAERLKSFPYSSTFPDRDFLNISKESHSQKISYPVSFDFRYRIARNRRNAFFRKTPQKLREISQFLRERFPGLDYLGREGDVEFWSLPEWMESRKTDFIISGLESSPSKNSSSIPGMEIQGDWNISIKFCRFRLGDEDEIRFEILGKARMENNLFLSRGMREFFINEIPYFAILRRLFSSRDLFSFRKKWGFVNSCPSNCGRGDRFSLKFSDRNKQMPGWEENGMGLATQGAETMVFGKNFTKQRKFYFQHRLLPLVFNRSDLIE